MKRRYSVNKRKFVFIMVCLTILIIVINVVLFKDKDAIAQKKENSETSKIKNMSVELVLESKTQALLNESFTKSELENISISYELVQSKKFGNKRVDFNYNEETMYETASTIKVPIAMYIYDLAKKNPSILEDTISITDWDYEGGTGILQGYQMGTPFTTEELIKDMIIYSDNIATNMLLRTYFNEPSNLSQELTPYFGEADYENHESNSGNRLIALQYLYKHSDEYKTLISYMANTEYRDYIPKYLPDSILIANKIGITGGTIHDYALIETDAYTYLITLSMDGIDNEESRMAELSKSIYDLIKSVV